MIIYEVKSFGVTVEWTDSFKEAEAAYKDTAPGECKLYKVVGSNKVLLRAK